MSNPGEGNFNLSHHEQAAPGGPPLARPPAQGVLTFSFTLFWTLVLAPFPGTFFVPLVSRARFSLPFPLTIL